MWAAPLREREREQRERRERTERGIKNRLTGGPQHHVSKAALQNRSMVNSERF
jgi:hypothetical protein